MFNWNDLRFFLEIARGHSLEGAARALGVNHSTVSRRIQALEDSLSARLFDRTHAGHRLTAAGEKFLALAESVESACIHAQETVTGQDAALSGPVRLSVPEGFGSYFLVRHLDAFRAKYPGIELWIIAMPEVLSVSKREADIAVSFRRPTTERVIARRLSDYILRYYAAKSYLSAVPPIFEPCDLKHLNVFIRMASANDYQSIEEYTESPHAQFHFKSVTSLLHAVEAGLGISLLPCYMVEPRHDLVAVLPERISVKRTLWLSMHEDLRHVARVKAVWDWIGTVVALQQGQFLGAESLAPAALPAGETPLAARRGNGRKARGF